MKRTRKRGVGENAAPEIGSALFPFVRASNFPIDDVRAAKVSKDEVCEKEKGKGEAEKKRGKER